MRVYRPEQRSVQPAFIMLPSMPNRLGTTCSDFSPLPPSRFSPSQLPPRRRQSLRRGLRLRAPRSRLRTPLRARNRPRGGCRGGLLQSRGLPRSSGRRAPLCWPPGEAVRPGSSSPTAIAEPKPSTPRPSEPRTARTKVANENSSSHGLARRQPPTTSATKIHLASARQAARSAARATSLRRHDPVGALRLTQSQLPCLQRSRPPRRDRLL